MTEHTNTYPDLVNVEDWLNASGYTGEAGACHAAMSLIRKQETRIADLRKEADMMHSEYKTACSRIAALESLVDAKGKMYDEILSASVKTVNELRAALLPFAAIADESTENLADNYMYSDCFPMSAFRAARAALEKK
jgi:hypothetical protein